MCGSCIPYLVCANVWLSSLSFSPLSPVLAELQQADLITSQECEGLYNQSIVVKVQSGKSPEVQDETAFILKRNGFEKESHFLAGKQTQPLIHVPVVCCTVEPIWRQLSFPNPKSRELIYNTNVYYHSQLQTPHLWPWNCYSYGQQLLHISLLHDEFSIQIASISLLHLHLLIQWPIAAG